jgi:Bacterial regulatory helix-turn-helix protein, lysR family
MVNLPSFRQLEHLVPLADHGHFGRAAKACHVTQSTLSASIKELEKILQASLVCISPRNTPMKMLRLITSTLLAIVIAIPYADAQISVGGSTANLPTPQGTIGATGPNVGCAGSSVSPGNYGPGNVGPGATGPGRLGPGAYGRGNIGPGAHIGGAAGPAEIGLSIPTEVTGLEALPHPAAVSGSSMTRRWREQDSNPRSRVGP